MSINTADKIINNVFRDLYEEDEVTFIFQGGEPTLVGLPWYRHFVANASSKKAGVKVHYAFQTNGLLLDESWCELFRENDFLIGLSIDGSKRFHNYNRLSSDGGGTYDTCMEKKDLMEKNHVEYNILCVLTNDIANEPDKVWNFIINENIRYIQFIPCLEPLATEIVDPKKTAGNALRPVQFASFYSRLLRHWIPELEKGNYISIKLFDDVVNFFMRDMPTSCGIDGQCHNLYVVEADGSVFPCDFYASDIYKIGNLTESTPGELFNTAKVQDFLHVKPALPAICGTCPWFSRCNGGCKRLWNVMYAGAGGALCGFRIFLEKCLKPLETTVLKIFK